MEAKVIDAALAGLLHDLGKVEQRARLEPWKPPDDVDPAGQPVHAAWSEAFIARHVPQRFRPAARQGVFHHVPDKSLSADHSLSELVALADKLSAGERADEINEAEKHKQPKQVITIFERISLSGARRKTGFQYLPLREVKLTRECIFPGKEISEEDQLTAYELLRDSLAKSIEDGPDDAESFLESTLAALRHYTWSIPSAYYHNLPDVSLYDHSRMTAAIASCLAERDPTLIRTLLDAVTRAFREKPEEGDRKLLDTPLLMLVGGDISGIQNFIYTISARHAAKTLRGRSFYLQLLNEAVLRYVLRKLGIPYSNVIYAGGGHFYLLAPLSAKEKLAKVQRYVTETLLAHHGIDLYLAIGRTEVPASGFKVGAFPEYWGKMHAALHRVKQQKYVELGEELHSKVFKPHEHGGNREKVCALCGEEDEGTSKIAGEDLQICPLCNSFDVDLGKELPQSRFVALGFSEAKGTPKGSALDTLRAFGMHVQFLRDSKDKVEFGMDTGVERAVIWALGDEPKWPQTGKTPAAHVLHYTVNQVPQQDFNELQEKAIGIPRLGVLRMDVDNAGEMFQHGFSAHEASEQNIATIARLSTLSFQLSLFFEGWVKKLCETNPDIYAVYAGGDDVFLIGPWNQMPSMACKINEDLQAFSAGNRDMHISGGMSFIHGKYPIHQAAEDAGEEENRSKQFEGKEAFTFLDRTYHWQRFREVEAMKDRLVNLVSDEKLKGPSAVLQLLQRLGTTKVEMQKKRVTAKLVYGPWLWIGDYMFRRMAEQYQKSNPAVAEEIKAIHEAINSEWYKDIEDWQMAARWAQITLRTK